MLKYRNEILDMLKCQASLRRMSLDEVKKWLAVIDEDSSEDIAEADNYVECLKGDDFVVCRECGKRFKFISASHLTGAHNIKMKTYMDRHKCCYADLFCNNVYRTLQKKRGIGK